MKHACCIFICLLPIMLSCVVPTKVIKETAEITAEVTAKHGLILYESPDLKSNTITQIPWAENVEVLGYGNHDITMEGITSKWARVRYDDTEGWVFGGYLIPVEPHEKIRLVKKNSARDYIGAVYTEFDASIRSMGGSMIGGRFSVSIIVSGSSEIILFNESISRTGSYIKWKIVDVFTVPAAPAGHKFFYPGLCSMKAGPGSPGEAFAIAKDRYDDRCEFKAIQRAWMFDFTEKKVREIPPKNIICRQECCGRGCM